MKLCLSWLNDWVDIPWSVDETAARLTELGFPVETISMTGVQCTGVVAAKILQIDKHPNADRLRLAKVYEGSTELWVVCGAPNIEVGQIVPLALPGAHLSGGIKIVVSKIRGVESSGMLCSERELGLSQEHAGIMMLPSNTPPGIDVRQVLGSDVVFDIDVTPNRPDMLSHVGVARELAAVLGQPLKSISQTEENEKKAFARPIDISIDDSSLCMRYMGRVISDVLVGPSPQWMQARLSACGIRPINNVVDVTNYVLLEWGHPLHAFDYELLSGQKIKVRRAWSNEKMVALDGKSYTLSTDMLVIADEEKPVAIAGVMGSERSGVCEKTKHILLESAVFDRTSIRLTSRALNLKTESSLRFEKGTDVESCEQASVRAAQLIEQICHGKTGLINDVFPVKPTPISVFVSEKEIPRLLGVDIEPSLSFKILTGLGYKVDPRPGGLSCVAPLHRKDISESADIIEDIARLFGYNNIPSRQPQISVGNMDESQWSTNWLELEHVLRGMGLSQTLSSSFTSVEWAERSGLSKETLIELANPISQEESILRPFLILNLLKAAQFNARHQRDFVGLFEIGTRFRFKNGFPEESQGLAILLTGEHSKTWNETQRKPDFFVIKGILEKLDSLFSLGLQWVYEGDPSFLHPYQSFRLLKGSQEGGWGGVVHPSFTSWIEISPHSVVAELSISLWTRTARSFSPISVHPFVERDLALVVPSSVSWADIEKHVKVCGGELLNSVLPFDIYQDKKLGSEKKSLAFRIKLQHPSKTLTDMDVNSLIDRLMLALKESCGAELRR